MTTTYYDMPHPSHSSKPSMHSMNQSSQMAYVPAPHSPHRGHHSSSPSQPQYSLMPTYSPPIAYNRIAHNGSPSIEDQSVVRPLALRRHTSPQQHYTHAHLMVPQRSQAPVYHPNQAQYHHRQLYFPHSPTPVSPSPSSPTLSIVPQFASDDDDTGSGSAGSAGNLPQSYIVPPQYSHPAHHMHMVPPITHYAMPVPQMRHNVITHVAVPTMQAQATPVIQHPHHMQQHHPHHMMHPSHPHYGPPTHPGAYVMLAPPPQSQHHPHQAQMQMNGAVPAIHVEEQSSNKPKGSKRTATQMREFVRSYFANHSSSLVNKDLSTISHELQVAYEREFPSHCVSILDKSDRKPVFCRTFIQKVARQMGFLLTLNYGLVDKRMKHLMKIRKRGKKVKKAENPADGQQEQEAGDGEGQQEQDQEDHDLAEEHEMTQQNEVAVKNENGL